MALRPQPGWRTFAARAGLGFVAALWCAGAAGAVVEEAKPDGDPTLTLEEFLWCRFERLRLEGEDSELDLSQGWEVERYNAATNIHNALCAGKPHATKDRSFVEEALTPEYQDALRREGTVRLIVARAEREARGAYAKSAPATVRAEPSGEAAQVGTVAQWGDVFPTGETQGGWTQVEWGLVKPGAEPDHAWVLSALLAPGVGAEARFAHCEGIAGTRPFHNDVVRGEISLEGDVSFKFRNGNDADAYVKLVHNDGGLVIGFVVAAGSIDEPTHAEIKGMPPGSYEVFYGTGKNFSRGCDSFSLRGFAKRFVEPLEFVEGKPGWIYQVHSAGGGATVEVEFIDYAAFDNL